MVRPVFVSPFVIGQLMELGPRYFGSSDGWNWIVPCFGMFTNSCGANCSTKAMMPMSASSSFIAAVASGALSEGNWKTLRPFSTRGDLHGVGLGALLLGRAEHARDGVAAGEERLEDGLAEVLLSDDCDAHGELSGQ